MSPHERIAGERRTLIAGAALMALAPGAFAQSRRPLALTQPALQVARPTQATLLTVARSGRRLVAAGERGLVIVSDDGGTSWAQARVPVGVTLTALTFLDDREGFAAGHLGVLLRTQDGGASWQTLLDGRQVAALAIEAARAAGLRATRPDEAERAALALEDAQRLEAEGADKPWLALHRRRDGGLLALGAYGLALASDDRGRSWRALMPQLPNPDGLNLYGWVQRGDQQFLFGEQGLLLAATGGGPFLAQVSPTEASQFGALALRDGTLLLMGLRGKVWRSAAPGAPWAEVRTPVDASLLAGTELSDGRIVLVGAAGQVLLSADRGASFRPVALAQRFPFSAVLATADGRLLLAGLRGLQVLPLAELDRPAQPQRVDARLPAAARAP